MTLFVSCRASCVFREDRLLQSAHHQTSHRHFNSTRTAQTARVCAKRLDVTRLGLNDELIEARLEVELGDHLRVVQLDHQVVDRRTHVAIPLRAAEAKEIGNMLANDVIEPVDGPTPSVSANVPVPKQTPGEVRI